MCVEGQPHLVEARAQGRERPTDGTCRSDAVREHRADPGSGDPRLQYRVLVSAPGVTMRGYRIGLMLGLVLVGSSARAQDEVDTDSDGVPDAAEFAGDTDGDGAPDVSDDDDD